MAAALSELAQLPTIELPAPDLSLFADTAGTIAAFELRTFPDPVRLESFAKLQADLLQVNAVANRAELAQAGEYLSARYELPEVWQSQFQLIGSQLSNYSGSPTAAFDAAERVATDFGWPLPIFVPSDPLLRLTSISKPSASKVSTAIKTIFAPRTQAYSLVQKKLLDSKHFKPRRPALRQAFRAIQRREWYLVVSTLLPMVEGVLVDAMWPPGSRPKRGRKVREAVAKMSKLDEVGLRLAVTTLETMILGAGSGRSLYKGFDPNDYGGPGEPRELNRHAIAHGAAHRYGNGTNAYRLLLILVLIAECLELADAIKP